MRSSCSLNLSNEQTSLKKSANTHSNTKNGKKRLGFYQGCRSAAQLHVKEKERATLLVSAEEQKIKITRIEADRGIEENELSYLKADLADIDELINKKSGPDYLKLIADLEEAKSGIKLAEQTIARLKKDKESNLEGINRVFADAKRAETRVAELSDQIRALSIDRTNIAMEIATSRAQLEKIENEICQYSAETEEARQKLFALMEEAEVKRGERSAILHQQDMLIEKSRMRTSELERLTALQKQLDEEYTAKQEQLSQNKQTVAELVERKKELDRTLSELESNLFAQRSSLERLNGEIKDAEQDVIRLESAQQARGESGGRAIEAVKSIEGVHGTIAELARAPPEYSTALNVAAGNKLQFVVCDTDQIAADAIRYLKDERLGRVTFLPLNKLKPPTLPPVKEPGVIDYAVNLLDYDPVYDKALATALGATVVVDTLERARKMIGKYRMVTIEGELLERSGAMTGGLTKKPVKGFGAAVDDEIVRIRSHLAELSGEAAMLEAGVKRLTEEVDAKRALRNEIDQDMARAGAVTEEYSRRFDAITVEKQTIEAAVARQKEETGTSAGELAALEGELDKVTETINAITAQIDGIKKKLDDTNIPALTEQMEKRKKAIEEAERHLRNKEADMNDASRERQHFNSRIGELN